MKKNTLLKFLTNSNIGARRFCFDLIKQGDIRVNDKIISQPMFEIHAQDKIYYDDRLIKFKEDSTKPVYIMLNKPQKYICSLTNENEKPSIMNLIKHKNLRKKHLFPVGRLDFLTEGLIFITNDGDFANFLTQAKNKIPKHYYVEIKGKITETDIRIIQNGIMSGKTIFNVKDIRVVSAAKKISKLIIVLTEGKNREIRNIFAYLKYKIRYLKRFQIGPFKLDPELNPGEYKLIKRPTL